MIDNNNNDNSSVSSKTDDDNISIATDDILEMSEMYHCLNKFLLSSDKKKNITDVLYDISKQLKEIKKEIKNTKHTKP